MAVQTTYNWTTGRGIAGGLVDLTPHDIDSFINEEENGVLKPGMAVMQGTTPGKQIKIFGTGGTAATFEGVVNNNRTTEYDLDGHIRILKGAGTGVLHWGRIYALVAADVEPEYGDPLFVVSSGDDAGKFSNADGSDSTADPAVAANAVAVKGRFLGPVENGIAPIELYNQAQA